jgi:hypothetical protein
MDFEAALGEIGTWLEGRYRWAVVGGLGLAAYGLARTTLDLDIAVDAAAQDALIARLEGLGYRTLHRSSGYSNHLHDSSARGRVDIVYVAGETADRLFGEARRFPGPGGRDVPVPRPEHLAAMKALSIKNDPDRVLRDLEDVRFLLSLPGVDREEVRRHFERYGLLEKFRAIE